jgi:hypothetical protein
MVNQSLTPSSWPTRACASSMEEMTCMAVTFPRLHAARSELPAL